MSDRGSVTSRDKQPIQPPIHWAETGELAHNSPQGSVYVTMHRYTPPLTRLLYMRALKCAQGQLYSYTDENKVIKLYYCKQCCCVG